MVTGSGGNDGQQHVRIVPFEDRHAPAFCALNLEWIEAYFAVEDLDRVHLFQPRASFVDSGGAIFMAELDDGSVIGCCGLLKHDEHVYEVSKMAVTRAYQGKGVGRKLLDELIVHARLRGAKRLEIISSTRLGAAIHLYQQIGFREVPLESDAYARGNIALMLDLDAMRQGRGDG